MTIEAPARDMENSPRGDELLAASDQNICTHYPQNSVDTFCHTLVCVYVYTPISTSDFSRHCGLNPPLAIRCPCDPLLSKVRRGPGKQDKLTQISTNLPTSPSPNCHLPSLQSRSRGMLLLDATTAKG